MATGDVSQGMEDGNPIIRLSGSRLSFTFPDIPRHVRLLAREHVENMLAEAPHARRAQLLREFWSSWRLGEYSPAIDKRLYQSVQLMSHAEREEILRHLMAPGQTVESLPKTVPVPRIMDTLRDAVLENEPSIEDASAELNIHFQRTLRVPVDDRKYLLPAGQGLFPLCAHSDMRLMTSLFGPTGFTAMRSLSAY